MLFTSLSLLLLQMLTHTSLDLRMKPSPILICLFPKEIFTLRLAAFVPKGLISICLLPPAPCITFIISETLSSISIPSSSSIVLRTSSARVSRLKGRLFPCSMVTAAIFLRVRMKSFVKVCSPLRGVVASVAQLDDECVDLATQNFYVLPFDLPCQNIPSF